MTGTPSFTRSTYPSPVGQLLLVLDGPALVALDFEGFEARMMRLLKRRFPRAALTPGSVPKAVAEAGARLALDTELAKLTDAILADLARPAP